MPPKLRPVRCEWKRPRVFGRETVPQPLPRCLHFGFGRLSFVPVLVVGIAGLSTTDNTQIRGLLSAAAEGDEAALNALIPILHGDLRSLARRHLFRQAGKTPTLCTTALVNEAFIRLAASEGLSFKDRAHFLSYCSRVMRGIVVDQARSQSSLKRGGNQTVLALDENVPASTVSPEQVLAIDQAIDALEAVDFRLAKVTEMRVFGGLSLEECAIVLDSSERSISRVWRKARAMLGAALDHPP